MTNYISSRGGHNIGVQRNNLVKAALKENADLIWFIDSDMIFSENPKAALEALYDMHVPIASGLARIKKENVHPFAVYRRDSATGVYQHINNPPSDPFTVDAVGKYCCLIKREVFANVKAPWFDYSIFDEYGEDQYFCEKAKEAGYNITINPAVKLGHQGLLTILPDGSVWW